MAVTLASFPYDPNNAAFQGEALLTVGQQPAFIGRSIKIDCTVPGTITIQYPDGSTGIWTIAASTATYTMPLGVAMLVAMTATATISTLK